MSSQLDPKYGPLLLEIEVEGDQSYILRPHNQIHIYVLYTKEYIFSSTNSYGSYFIKRHGNGSVDMEINFKDDNGKRSTSFKRWDPSDGKLIFSKGELIYDKPKLIDPPDDEINNKKKIDNFNTDNKEIEVNGKKYKLMPNETLHIYIKNIFDPFSPLWDLDETVDLIKIERDEKGDFNFMNNEDSHVFTMNFKNCSEIKYNMNKYLMLHFYEFF